MLDTNLFNDVLSESVPVKTFCELRLFATHVQADELRATKNLERRNALLSVFKDIEPENVVTRSAVWNVTAWNQANWSKDDGVFEKMLARLKELDAASKKKRPLANQQCDILIAETAVKNGLTLVTGDRNLRVVTSEFGGRAVTLAELQNGI